MDLLIALLYLLIGFVLDMVLFYIFNKRLEIGDFVIVLLFWPMVIPVVLLCLAALAIAYPLYKLYMVKK